MAPYVSCMYAPPDETGMSVDTKQGENARITCIDDQGRVWWLTENSEVGDWLEFVENGGTVTPYVAEDPDEAPFIDYSDPLAGAPKPSTRRKK